MKMHIVELNELNHTHCF